MGMMPFCPWCFDAAVNCKDVPQASEVEPGPCVGNPARVVSWHCKACHVGLSAKKWAKAMEWVAKANGINLEEIAPEVERAAGGVL